MHNTFTHKVLMSMFCGFGAACMFWVFRHFVQEAIWETSNEGWKKSLHGSTAEHQKR